jgi:hypothetical protein
LEGLGVKISNGIAKFKTIVVERIIIGSPEKPTGIILYDEKTGEPYCVKISDGKLKNTPGECEDSDDGQVNEGSVDIAPVESKEDLVLDEGGGVVDDGDVPGGDEGGGDEGEDDNSEDEGEGEPLPVVGSENDSDDSNDSGESNDSEGGDSDSGSGSDSDSDSDPDSDSSSDSDSGASSDSGSDPS